MGKTLERFTINSAGFREILRSDEVRADLLRRAEQVKTAAQPHMPDEFELIADSFTGQNRASAGVIGVPMRLESRRRILGAAIDAAR